MTTPRDTRTRGAPAAVTCRRVTTLDELIDALRIRVAVFVQEQGFEPGWDPDPADHEAEHFIAECEGRAVGTARLREVGPGAFKIERMAVLSAYRGRGIGTALTRHLVSRAERAGRCRVWMDAQSHAMSFYEQLGFHAVSDEFCPWGDVPHVTMER